MRVRRLALLALALSGVACGTVLSIAPDTTGTTTDGGDGSDGNDSNADSAPSDAPADGSVDHASESATDAARPDTCPARDCNVGTCAAGNCARLVFVTTNAYAIGGSNNPRNLGEADAICQGLAVTRGLKNAFRAWLSDSAQYPADGTRFTQSTQPYVLLNGTMVAASFGALISGVPLLAPINVTEGSVTVTGGDFAWTGTRVDGQRAPNASCTSWSDNSAGPAAYAGDVNATSAMWTEQSLPCSGTGHFYCFEQ